MVVFNALFGWFLVICLAGMLAIGFAFGAVVGTEQSFVVAGVLMLALAAGLDLSYRMSPAGWVSNLFPGRWKADLRLRRSSGASDLVHPMKGAHLFFIPLWLLSGFATVMVVFGS